MFTKTAVAAVLVAACLSAQRPGSAEELVIRRLSNPDAAAADAAMIDFIRGGVYSVVPLKNALAVCQDPKVRARAERALAICAVDAPVDNGVKVGLRVDRKEVKPGESVKLTATVCNVSDAPVAIHVGVSYSGSVLENGLSLQRLAADGEAKDQARFGAVGFCATGAQVLVEVLPPWSSKEFVTTAKYQLQPKPDSRTGPGPQLAINYVFLPVDPDADGGKLTLRLRHEVDPAADKDFQSPKAKPDWKGKLVSNTIELQLRAGG